MTAPNDPDPIDPAPIDPAEFHRRLDAALGVEPSGASPTEDLAAGKRRLRRRRTTWAAVAATAVVAVMVPTAVALSGPDGPTGGGPSGQTTSTAEPTPGRDDWRWESYRDATFRVPDSWGYGGVSSWCLDRSGPEVRMPHQAERTIGCRPARGYGVEYDVEGSYETVLIGGRVVRVPGPALPGWFGHVVVGGVVVKVFTPDRELTQQILDSVQPIEGEDANGCAASLELDDDLRRAPALDELDSVDSVAVCRYDVSRGPRLEELLVQSERLTGGDAAAVLAALQETRPRSESRMVCPKQVTAQAVRLVLDGQPVWVSWGNTCRAKGVLDGSDVRTLTHDVVWWALSPGWTGEPPAVVGGGKGDPFQPRRRD